MAAKESTKKSVSAVPAGAMGDLQSAAGVERFLGLSPQQVTENANRALRLLIESVDWPDKLTVWSGSLTDRADSIKTDSQSLTHTPDGTFWSAKNKRSIKYDSPLQFRFYQLLEEASLVLWYSRRESNGRSMGTPGEGSVLITLSDKRILLAEIMPVKKMSRPNCRGRLMALSKHCHSAGLGFMVTDGNYSLRQLERHCLTEKLAEKFLDLLLSQKAGLDEKQCQQFLLRENASELDLVTIILKNGLDLEHYPFRVSRNTNSKLSAKTRAAKYMRL